MRKIRSRLFQNACTLSFLAVMSMLLAACGSGTDTLKALPTSNAGASQAANPTPAPSVAAPTVAPSPVPAGLELTSKGFYMTESLGSFRVLYAFTVRNADTKNALERNAYQVSVFDAENRPLGSDSGYVSLVFPGETTAKAGSVSVSSRASRIEVAVSKGASSDAKGLKPIPTVNDARYEPETRGSLAKVVASVTNPYGVDLKDVQVTTVFYDAGGTMLGGASTFLNLLPANGSSVASVTLSGAPPTPAKVVAYPSISALTLLDLQKR